LVYIFTAGLFFLQWQCKLVLRQRTWCDRRFFQGTAIPEGYTSHTYSVNALAESIVEKTKDIASMEKEDVVSSQKIDVEDAPHLRLIIESIRRTAEYASDIAEIVLNLTIESILV
jgi:hypothetical protein